MLRVIVLTLKITEYEKNMVYRGAAGGSADGVQQQCGERCVAYKG